jgi:Holliday junction DNA helicase RuvA
VIASLSGTVAATYPAGAVIDESGVGYLVHAPTSVLAGLKVGKSAKLFTELVVREDSMTLYGFVTAEQQEIFRLLVGVTGLGPKSALAILSSFDPQDLRRVIATSDIETLTTVPGIGRRGAQRIVLELKDKLEGGPEAIAVDSKTAEVRDALVGLGYTAAELRDVLPRVASDDRPVEELVRSALRELAPTAGRR